MSILVGFLRKEVVNRESSWFTWVYILQLQPFPSEFVPIPNNTTGVL